jgi:hypothetical protein
MLEIKEPHLESLGNYIIVKRNMVPTITTAVQSRPYKFRHQPTIQLQTPICQPKKK